MTAFGYDAQGNQTSTTDPNSKVTTFGFDALNHLISQTDPVGVGGVTEFGYDALDRLVSVTDAKRLTTTYTYNALGDLKTLVSPDTGETTYTYDAAGNRLTQTDSRDIEWTYTHDALNRVTSISYPTAAEDITSTYDEGTNGIGRLTGMTDESGPTAFAYNVRGNVLTETRTLGGDEYVTSHTYDEVDRIATMTYPSGAVVTYHRDALGRVSSIDLTAGSTTTLLSDIEYEPFGPVKSFTFGNALSLSRTFDLDYRLTAQGAGSVQDLTFGRPRRQYPLHHERHRYFPQPGVPLRCAQPSHPGRGVPRHPRLRL